MHCPKLYIGILLLSVLNTVAQDIEPRRWTPLPLHMNYLGVGYGYSNGKIFFDPVMEIEDASVEGSAIVVQYVRPFKLGKKLARVDVSIPYTFATWEGLLGGSYTAVHRNGFSDPRLRLSLNILGPGALEAKELRDYIIAHPVHTIVGVSFAVTFPLGQYYDDKLLNLGQNRFTFRPQAGLTHNWRNWSYELTGSVFLYSSNNDFFNNSKRKQDPVFALQTHLIRRFNKGMWGSVSFGTGLAGQSLINNQPKDEQENFMGALSFGFPVFKKQAVKLVYLRSQTLTDVGGDTNSFGLVWSTAF